jgi:Glycogen recognition site of AMP-activated protein kinase
MSTNQTSIHLVPPRLSIGLLILCTLCCTAIPAVSSGAVPVYFQINLPEAQSVYVVGEFNDWSQTRFPLKQAADGVWTGKRYVPSGIHAYKLIVDGEWMLDPSASDTIDMDGVINSKLEAKKAVVEKVDLHRPAPQTAPAYRTWTAASGTTLEATLERTEVNHVVLQKKDGERVKIGLRYLSKQDQQFIKDTPPQGKSSSLVLADGRVRLGEYILPTDVLNRLEVPCDQEAWRQAKKISNRLKNRTSVIRFPKGETAEMGILLPRGFDPSHPWPILIVNAPGSFSNVGHLECCFMAAADCNYVAIAVDGPGEDRWTQAGTALAYLKQHWPESENWPIACAGFSGGAKVSGLLGATATKLGYRCIGVWMGGCNEDYASSGLQKLNAKAYRRTPMYLASGTVDDIATPEHHQGVYTSLDKSGFKTIRLESYEGGHHPVPQKKVQEGLLWFRELAGL